MRKKIVLILGLVLLAGCATVSQPEKFPYPTFSMNNVPYFVLTTMCDQEGVKWDYDPLSKIVILKSQGKEFKLLIGSKKIMIDETFSELSGPVEIRESVIYAPVDLRGYMPGALCKLPRTTLPLRAGVLRPVESVIIDAGHGGKDTGAIGRYGLREKDVVLDVVEKVKEDLEHCGLKVYLTRSDDEFVELPDRSRIANGKKADLFVSIHANANHSRWIEGFEVYYLTESVDDNARALASAENSSLEINNQSFWNQPLSLKAMLWDLIYTENRKESIVLAKAICNSVSKQMKLKMLGVKGAPFAVLKGTQMPAVLVEIGYISNSEGERKLRDAEYRKRMAEAIAEGIFQFKNSSEGKK